MTIPEIAGACHVSPSGFKQHLRFYHKNILEQKRKKRSEAQARPEKKRGELSGNGRTYKPSLRTEDKYAKALSLYKDTALTLKEIAERTHRHSGRTSFLSAQMAYRLSEGTGRTFRQGRRGS